MQAAAITLLYTVLRGSEIIMTHELRSQAYWRTFAAEREGKLPEGVTEEEAPTTETATAQTGKQRAAGRQQRCRAETEEGRRQPRIERAARNRGGHGKEAEVEHGLIPTFLD